MRSLKNSVPAFTIMEVTISMLVAAIVVAITYSAYGIMSRSWLAFNDKNQEMGTVLRLNGLLRRDLEKASLVEQEPAGIVMQVGERQVHYQVRPEQVVRISSIRDTFQVKSSPLKIYFEGKEINGTVEYGEQMVTSNVENGAGLQGKQVVDEISFSVTLQNMTLPFHYSKLYSAESLMAINP